MGLLPAGFVPVTQRAPGPSQGPSLSWSCLLSIIYKCLGSYPGGLAQRPEAALSPRHSLPSLIQAGNAVLGTLWPLCLVSATQCLCLGPALHPVLSLLDTPFGCIESAFVPSRPAALPS